LGYCGADAIPKRYTLRQKQSRPQFCRSPQGSDRQLHPDEDGIEYFARMILVRLNAFLNDVEQSALDIRTVELGERFDDPGRAKHQLFDYIEIFYNQRRRHSSLDYVSPGEYERAAGLNETSAA